MHDAYIGGRSEINIKCSLLNTTQRTTHQSEWLTRGKAESLFVSPILEKTVVFF